MKTLVIIPARFASSRFPGKLLAELGDKPVLRHVWERASAAKSVSKVIIATDHRKILEAGQSWGAEVIMTSDQHETGTKRVAEVARILQQENFDVVINVQGDEPFVNPKYLDQLIDHLKSNTTFSIATLCTQIKEEAEIINPNVVKVVHSKGKAQYFSRAPIPFLRDQLKGKSIVEHGYFQHLGIYAFKIEVLLELAKLPTSKWAEMEKLEQLSWMENDYNIGIIEVEEVSFGIDTPEDLEKANRYLSSKN